MTHGWLWVLAAALLDPHIQAGHGEAAWWQVWAALVSVQLGDVAGFDLSYLNRYRWHPQAEKVDLAR